MPTITFGALELSASFIAGGIGLAFINGIGSAMSKIYFEPWLKRFKNRHDKVLKRMRR